MNIYINYVYYYNKVLCVCNVLVYSVYGITRRKLYALSIKTTEEVIYFFGPQKLFAGILPVDQTWTTTQLEGICVSFYTRILYFLIFFPSRIHVQMVRGF